MNLIKKALSATVAWANTPEKPELTEAETNFRAEKIAVYTALLTQYWTWLLEILKQLAFFNGLGLAASATIVASSPSLGKMFGGWFFSFFIGLAAAAYGMLHGMETLRKMREDQIRAIESPDTQHPEMSATKVTTSMKLFILASLFAFGIGIASILVAMQRAQG